jgi:uncharacterized C2H2 Zn-finger protein
VIPAGYIYESKDSYSKNLRKAHGLAFSSRNIVVDHDNQPDNNYCKSCKTTYKDKYSYRRHIRNIHKMQVISGKYDGKIKQVETSKLISLFKTQKKKNCYCIIQAYKQTSFEYHK